MEKLQLRFLSDDSDDDDILTVKRKNIDIDDIPMIKVDDSTSSKKEKKVVTKAAMVKKILKKKIVANKITKFDAEGQVRIVTVFLPDFTRSSSCKLYILLK